MSQHQGGPPPDLLDRIRAVVPLIAERAGDAEVQRKPDDDVIAALEATDVFRSFVPKSYGGFEIDLDLFISIGADVSEACPSTGWITTFYMEHNWLISRFPLALREELFGSQPYVLAPGSVNPSGRAIRHDDHYELSGHWQFGTGVTHADWVLLSGFVVDDESPFPRMFLAPAADVEVKDTWHVDGMCATGSRDIVAESITVPLHRASPAPGTPVEPASPYLDRIPLRPMLSLTAAIPSIGCARRAVQLFRARCAERVMFGQTKAQSEMAMTPIRLADLTSRTWIAERTLRGVAAEMMTVADGERTITDAEMQLLRVSIARVVRMCRDIVRDVLEASGAKAHFLDNELQRIQRDMHMVAAHTVFDIDLVAGEAGRLMLAEDAAAAESARDSDR